MRRNHALILNPFCRCAGLLLAMLLLVAAFAPAAHAQTSAGPAAPPAPLATTQPPSTQNLKDWRAGMARVPLPKKGCFTSAYPSTKWQEVPCTTGLTRPYPPARGARPVTVGDGNDVSAEVTGHISTAVGSFESVTGVTSESDPSGANSYSLQLNTNTFTSSTCSGAANPSQCQGWQQFIYSSAGGAGTQYWLINYGTTNCPSGWMSYPIYGEDDCYTNGNGVFTSAETIANLVNLSLMGEAVSGGMDTLIFSTGSNLYSVSNEDSVVNLAQGWQEAEFNIFGDCCNYEANFNTGSTIVVRISVDYGSPSAPSCLGQGFTGETNNLSFASAPTAVRGTSPAIEFTESSAGGAASTCASATSVASGELTDTHDFNGDGDSDILFRNTSGTVALWLMNGGSILNSGGLGTIANTYSTIGQRDFLGTGKADMLWRDSSGNVYMWFMNGLTVTSSATLGNVPNTWTVYGTADMNGDGKGDLLWQNTSTGEVAIWFMNGSAISSTEVLGTVAPSTNWSIIGSTTGDILWRNTSGALALWQVSGSTVQSTSLGTVPSNWVVQGMGDFNGDGVPDILWRDSSSGTVAIWFLNSSGTVKSTASVGVVPTSTTWAISETGDFNGDGYSDILWIDGSGDVAVWFMNGATISSTAGYGNVGTSWSVQSFNAE